MSVFWDILEMVALLAAMVAGGYVGAILVAVLYELTHGDTLDRLAKTLRRVTVGQQPKESQSRNRLSRWLKRIAGIG